MTVIEKEEEENLDVNETMMEDTIDVVSQGNLIGLEGRLQDFFSNLSIFEI